MARIVVHLGTGTYFDLDDGCYILDTEDFVFDSETFESDMYDLVEAHGCLLQRYLNN